jgi:hypothetical protein
LTTHIREVNLNGDASSSGIALADGGFRASVGLAPGRDRRSDRAGGRPRSHRAGGELRAGHIRRNADRSDTRSQVRRLPGAAHFNLLPPGSPDAAMDGTATVEITWESEGGPGVMRCILFI